MSRSAGLEDPEEKKGEMEVESNTESHSPLALVLSWERETGTETALMDSED